MPPSALLGEIVLRVKNLQVMQEFYKNTIGLEIMQRFDDSVFFKIAPSYGPHTRVLGWFEESLPPDCPSPQFTGLDAQTTSLHPIAFTIGQEDFSSEKERIQ